MWDVTHLDSKSAKSACIVSPLPSSSGFSEAVVFVEKREVILLYLQTPSQAKLSNKVRGETKEQ